MATFLLCITPAKVRRTLEPLIFTKTAGFITKPSILCLVFHTVTECLLEGLVAIFEHIGGVPTEIWFDNTRTIVTKVIKGGGRDVTERFQRITESSRYS